MPQGIEERRLADGTVRYAVRVRRRGRSAFGVFDTPAQADAFRVNALAAIATGEPVPEAPGAPKQATQGQGPPREL